MWLNKHKIKTSNGNKSGIFVRPHQILYLVKRSQTNKTKIKKKKKSKMMKKRNYIKSMRESLPTKSKTEIFVLIPECDLSLMDIPKDVLQYNLSPFFHSFEKFKLRMVCNEFNDIFNDTKNILSSSIESDINYWTNHCLSKYYKISPNYFTHLDLRHDRLSYMTREEQGALKYFVIFNRNIENLLAQNVYKTDESKQEQQQQTSGDSDDDEENKEKDKVDILITRKENMIEMTRISFCNSSTDNCYKHTEWICHILQYYSSPNSMIFSKNVNCLKILDLNYVGLDDECLLKLCKALLSRKTQLNELEYLLLLNNINITDKYIDILFEAIEKNCNNLSHLNFRRCNLSDSSCSIISNFYLKNHETVSIKHVDLELNTKITKIGTDKINKIFQINNKKLLKELVIHYGANKKSYCWECRTLYDQ